MSNSASIPRTIQIRRGHLLGLIGAVAALTASITWIATAVPVGSETSVPGAQSHATSARSIATQPGAPTFAVSREQIVGLSTMALPADRPVDPLMSATPAQLAGIGLGTGYQLPSAQRSPSAADVLASMSPETRRSVESVLNLTFEQLAAGAAGSP
jgi:hypothetical protein